MNKTLPPIFGQVFRDALERRKGVPVIVDPIIFKAGDEIVEIPDALYRAYRRMIMDGTAAFTIGIDQDSKPVTTYVHPFLNTDSVD